MISARMANADDLSLISELIRQLAAYEGLLGDVSFDEEKLGDLLFGRHPAAEVLIGEIGGQTEGFALYFEKLSTFKGQLVLHLEDLFVRESARGRGLGTHLLREVAIKAAERQCARVEWAVLDWNAPAIRFYEALGAHIETDWRIVRLESAAFAGIGPAKS